MVSFKLTIVLSMGLCFFILNEADASRSWACDVLCGGYMGYGEFSPSGPLPPGVVNDDFGFGGRRIRDGGNWGILRGGHHRDGGNWGMDRGPLDGGSFGMHGRHLDGGNWGISDGGSWGMRGVHRVLDGGSWGIRRPIRRPTGYGEFTPSGPLPPGYVNLVPYS